MTYRASHCFRFINFRQKRTATRRHSTRQWNVRRKTVRYASLPMMGSVDKFRNVSHLQRGIKFTAALLTPETAKWDLSCQFSNNTIRVTFNCFITSVNEVGDNEAINRFLITRKVCISDVLLLTEAIRRSKERTRRKFFCFLCVPDRGSICWFHLVVIKYLAHGKAAREITRHYRSITD